MNIESVFAFICKVAFIIFCSIVVFLFLAGICAIMSAVWAFSVKLSLFIVVMVVLLVLSVIHLCSR